MRILLNRVLLLTLLFSAFAINQSQAQCLVHVKNDTLCKGSGTLLPIQLLGPSFATADSLVYSLNGQNIDGSLLRIWQDTGDYQVIVSSRDISGQVTCIDTGNFFVAPLPTVNFNLLTTDTQCFTQNSICIRNESTIWQADSGHNTHKILWGNPSLPIDSGYTIYGDTFCQSYINPAARQYTIFIQITDQRGCIVDQQFSTPYLKGLSNSLFNSKPDWCGPVSYGGNDFSINFDSSLIDSFKWNIDGGVFESQNLAFAYPLDIAGKHKLSLRVWTKDGCVSNDEQEISVMNPSIQTNKSDTLFVKDATIEFATPVVDKASFIWRFDDPSSGPNNFSTKNAAVHTFREPGKYDVTLQGVLNSCSGSDSKTIIVTGPLAKINTVSYDVLASCSPSDTVFLSQSSLYYFNDANNADDSIAANNRPEFVKGIWDFGDLNAPTCTTDTRNGLNGNTNCRYSVDSATKHLFSSNGIHTVRYFARDTVNNYGSEDSLVLQFGPPTFDDFEIESNCNSQFNDFYLRWNIKSNRPQSTFRILIDSAGDRNDNTPNVFDNWIHEGQTRYSQTTPNSLVKPFGIAIHQAYLTPTMREAYHEDGYMTVGLHLFNGDTNSSNYCDTIIWIHRALLLDRFDLGAKPTLTPYPQSDSLSWTMTDRRVLDLSEIRFSVFKDYSIDGDFTGGWSRYDKYVRNHQVGSHVYDYIIRTSGSTTFTTDSILIRHNNNGQLLFQDWRDTLIELPPTVFLKNGAYGSRVVHDERCQVTSYFNRHVLGHASAMQVGYPKLDSFLFVGDTLQLQDTCLYLLEKSSPNGNPPITFYSYWRDPMHHPDGRNRAKPPGGYETIEWKANGVSFANTLFAQFIPQDTGWYLIEAITTDSNGRRQTLSREIPVYGINAHIQLQPDSNKGPQMEQGDDPSTDFNTDLQGLLINRDCDYFIQFEQQSSLLDPCMTRYGVPCLPEVKSGILEVSTGLVHLFQNEKPVQVPFNLLDKNEYSIVHIINPGHTVRRDTVIDLDIHIEYAITDSTLCNDEPLIISNLSNGLDQDVQYVVSIGTFRNRFGDQTEFKVENLPRGTSGILVDVYPGAFVPGGIYCPIQSPLYIIQAGGTAMLDINGVSSGNPGEINLYRAEGSSSSSSNYQWSIDQGTLQSASNKDTISAFFNPGGGKIMVSISDGICPAAMDTLYFLTTGLKSGVAQRVKLYPNPSKGTLHFSGIEGKAVVHVYSSQGAEVFNNEVELGEFTLERLKPGVYYIRVEGYADMNLRFIIEE